VEILTVPEQKEKPVFDEQTLDKLLEAAYVLQEHNQSLRELDRKLQLKRDQVEASDQASSPPVDPPHIQALPSSAPPDYTLTLGKIVETQHHIQVRKLGLDEAMSLVAQRVMEMGAASGAAIALVNGQSARYAAVTGLKAPAAGSIVPVAKALCSGCIQTAQVVRCPDVEVQAAHAGRTSDRLPAHSRPLSRRTMTVRHPHPLSRYTAASVPVRPSRSTTRCPMLTNRRPS